MSIQVHFQPGGSQCEKPVTVYHRLKLYNEEEIAAFAANAQNAQPSITPRKPRQEVSVWFYDEFVLLCGNVRYSMILLSQCIKFSWTMLVKICQKKLPTTTNSVLFVALKYLGRQMEHEEISLFKKAQEQVEDEIEGLKRQGIELEDEVARIRREITLLERFV